MINLRSYKILTSVNPSVTFHLKFVFGLLGYECSGFRCPCRKRMEIDFSSPAIKCGSASDKTKARRIVSRNGNIPNEFGIELERLEISNPIANKAT